MENMIQKELEVYKSTIKQHKKNDKNYEKAQKVLEKAIEKEEQAKIQFEHTQADLDRYDDEYAIQIENDRFMVGVLIMGDKKCECLVEIFRKEEKKSPLGTLQGDELIDAIQLLKNLI